MTTRHHFLALVSIVGAFALESGVSLAAPQIRIPGGARLAVAVVRVESGQLFLRSEDGRLFSVPVDTPGLKLFLEGGGPEQQTPPGILTVQDILDLLNAGVSEETISAYIEMSGARYALSKDSLLALKRAGASEAFLQFLIRTGQDRETPVVDSGPPQPEPERKPSLYGSGIPYSLIFPGVSYLSPFYPAITPYCLLRKPHPGHPFFCGESLLPFQGPSLRRASRMVSSAAPGQGSVSGASPAGSLSAQSFSGTKPLGSSLLRWKGAGRGQPAGANDEKPPAKVSPARFSPRGFNTGGRPATRGGASLSRAPAPSRPSSRSRQ